MGLDELAPFLFLILCLSCLLIVVFLPFEVIGIIKRKALVKELAAAYHAECLLYCQELLELQRKWDEV